jgi:hypothetical protein
MDYKIQTPAGDIPLLFNTWTFRKYSETIGIELEDLLQNLGVSKAYKASHLPTLLLTAAESYCKFNSKEFTYTDLDACQWVDSFGGFNSEKLKEVYIAFLCKLYNKAPKDFEVQETKKKHRA